VVRIVTILPGIPGTFYLGKNVSTGTVHAVQVDARGWFAACHTNSLEHPRVGRRRAGSEYRPLTSEEIAAWEVAAGSMCSNCQSTPTVYGRLIKKPPT
jgi:hypothetical protein